MINAELDQQPLTEREWVDVQNRGFVQRWQRGEIYPAGIAESVRQLREVYGGGGVSGKKVEFKAVPAREARAALLSFYLSRFAETLGFVKEFRSDVLQGKLLPVERVDEWIKKNWTKEGWSIWAQIALPKRLSQEGEAIWDQDRQTFRTKSVMAIESFKYNPGVLEVEYRWLHYLPSGRPSEMVMTAADGILERLRICSERLAEIAKISPAEATMFILSGHPLRVPPCRQSVHYGPNDLAALNRILLDVDPTLSPREVGGIYRQMRSLLFKGRYRAMSEKHIRLALFTLSRGSHEPLKVAMESWNKLNRRWRYKEETNFGRDRTAAVRRANLTLASPGTTHDIVRSWLMGTEKPSMDNSKTKGKK